MPSSNASWYQENKVLDLVVQTTELVSRKNNKVPHCTLCYSFANKRDQNRRNTADILQIVVQLAQSTGGNFMIVADSACGVALAAALLMELHSLTYTQALQTIHQAFPAAPVLPLRFASLVRIPSHLLIAG